jgi:hypothetical protein
VRQQVQILKLGNHLEKRCGTFASSSVWISPDRNLELSGEFKSAITKLFVLSKLFVISDMNICRRLP